jgi:pimeloyl-ACP methyl ester carboxylesterase
MLISEYNSFYISGSIKTVSGSPKRKVTRAPNVEFEITENGTYHIEHAYVQHFKPAKSDTRKLPIVLVHGGGLCGTVWENTPDGRKGWLHFFIEQGYEVYIIDNVERGRAGWCPINSLWPDTPELRSAESTWVDFRLGSAANFIEKIPFQNQQFDVTAFDTLIKYTVPRWNAFTEQAKNALGALIVKIGKCIVIAHSQGGYIALNTLNDYSHNIHGLVLLEPFPTVSFADVNANLSHLACLLVYGDFFDKSKLWSGAKIAIEKMKVELSKRLRIMTTCDLPSNGIKGNSHMLMMDRNSDQVAAQVDEWILENISVMPEL